MENWVNVHELHCYRTREHEFNQWYDRVHLPDVVDTPGYVAATRYQIKEFKKGRGSYLTLYEVETDNIDETIRVRMEKLQTEIAAGRSSDLPINVWPFVFFRRIIRKTSATNVHQPGKPKWINLVETNPVSGKEQAYNEWYDRHLEDVLEAPGFVTANRFVIKEPLEGRGKYLAIYEIETDDIDETMRIRLERKELEVRQGKDPGLYILVWGTTLFRQIYRHPSE